MIICEDGVHLSDGKGGRKAAEWVVNMRKKGIFAIVLAVCICVAACVIAFFARKQPYHLELVPQDQFIFNQLTKKVRIEKVRKLIDQKADITDFLEKLGVTQYKYCDDLYYNGFPPFYTVVDVTPPKLNTIPPDEGGLLLIAFDLSGEYDLAMDVELSHLGKTELEKIKEGMTFDDVSAVDPSARFIQLSPGVQYDLEGYPYISLHYSSDGYAFLVFLESGIVTKIIRWTL